MNKPGAQQDQQHAALSAKVAELSADMETIKALVLDDAETVDIDPPTASPEPSFDLPDAGETLEAADALMVATTGIANGTEVWVHWFERNWNTETLIRETVTVDQGVVIAYVPNVPGPRILQLQVANSGIKAAVVVVIQGEQASPVVTKPGSAILPGTGWTKPTQTPPQIGNVTERAIAHWNVVPEQAIANGFTPGVCAHHLDGIDRVEISANGGPWVAVRDETINPRTGNFEYFAPLDLSSFTGDTIELRAIAVPNAGRPYVVKPLGSSYRNEDMTLYTREVGEVLELDAGEHNLKTRQLPERGWLTIRPKPGVDREDCVIVGESRDWRGGRVKLENLTVNLPRKGAGFMGRDNRVDGSQIGNHVWYDRCRIEGYPLGDKPNDVSWWIAHFWETQTYTDCIINNINKVFFSIARNRNLVRNCVIENAYEDVFNTNGLIVSNTVKRIDRQPRIDLQGLDSRDKRPHPDLSQLGSLIDTVMQDNVAWDYIEAQGIFVQGGRIEDVALVRNRFKTRDPWRVFHPQVPIDNLLIEGGVMDGGVTTSRASIKDGKRFVVRGVKDGAGNPWNPKLDGAEVYP